MRTVFGLFDPYELRARIAPTAIVFSPLVVLGVIAAATLPLGLGSLVGLGSLLLLAFYAGSFLVRHLGRAGEPALWEEWGGAPSTRLLRQHDPTFSADIKSAIRRHVQERLGVVITTGSTEEDQQIDDAFRLVRVRLRQLDPSGLWFAQLGEYGFVRNLFCSRWLLAVIGTLAAVGSGALWRLTAASGALAACVANVLIAVVVVPICQTLLRGPLRTTADRYAESAWTSFLHLEQTGK